MIRIELKLDELARNQSAAAEKWVIVGTAHGNLGARIDGVESELAAPKAPSLPLTPPSTDKVAAGTAHASEHARHNSRLRAMCGRQCRATCCFAGSSGGGRRYVRTVTGGHPSTAEIARSRKLPQIQPQPHARLPCLPPFFAGLATPALMPPRRPHTPSARSGLSGSTPTAPKAPGLADGVKLT
jgi:hypothetical protein